MDVAGLFRHPDELYGLVPGLVGVQAYEGFAGEGLWLLISRKTERCVLNDPVSAELPFGNLCITTNLRHETEGDTRGKIGQAAGRPLLTASYL